MKLVKIICFALSVAGVTATHAYGPEGHALVAAMAEARLMPAARAEVFRLLSVEGARGLDDVSSWADGYRAAHPETGPAHFVDTPLLEQSFNDIRDCHFDKDNQRVAESTCVVAKIPLYARALGDRSRPDQERLEALKWLTHLIGDIHQPLHAVDNQDRGGNSVSVAYFGKANNLHSVWDGGIIEKQYGWTLGPNFTFDKGAVRRAAEELETQITTEQRRAWGLQFNALDQNVVQWSNESHLLASAAYLGVPATKGDSWQERYQEVFWPVVQAQLQKASVRLTAVLNLVLASTERCQSIPGAFYAGPYVGTEDKLGPDDLSRDAYCASLFKSSMYPSGFVGVFGSSRISEQSNLPDPGIAEANRELYRGLRSFAQKWTARYGRTLPILTGAGGGLMEAASRGASDAGGPSIGYTTYYDPKHDPLSAFTRVDGKPIISDGLIFTSVAARESAMLAHSAVIIIGPGGTGTQWEVFQSIETLKSNQLTPVPVFFVGQKSLHWEKFYAFVDDMVRRGTLRHDEFYGRITHVEDINDLFEAVQARLSPK